MESSGLRLMLHWQQQGIGNIDDDDDDDDDDDAQICKARPK